MTGSIDKPELIRRSKLAFDELTGYCRNIPDAIFFQKPFNKWSIGGNIQHLILSVDATIPAFRSPTFLLRFMTGRPHRPSESYESLVKAYKLKLDAGGKAPGRYIPREPSTTDNKENILSKWQDSTNRYLASFEKNRTDASLDKYMVPHPLLGKITLRELVYFTIYHTQHHLNAIKVLYSEQNK